MWSWNQTSHRIVPLIQLWGCPASTVAVGGGVDAESGRLIPVFGTVYFSLFETLLFPYYAPWCRYDAPGVLASGSGLAASA